MKVIIISFLSGDSRNPDLKHYVLFIEIERQGTDFILSDEDKLRVRTCVQGA